MALPDALRQIEAPGVYDLSIFVGGAGQSFELDVVLSTTGGPVDLTGVTLAAEVRSLDDATVLAPLTAAGVAPLTDGKVRLTMTAAVADAIAWPAFTAANGSRVIRGRWHLAILEGTTRAVVLAGAAEVLR